MVISNMTFLAITSISDAQVYIALVVALIPGFLAWRLVTALYNS